jgi:23S rRNA pseudouridine1911/1915/1917 synthase
MTDPRPGDLPGAPPLALEYTVRPYEAGWTLADILERSLLLPRREIRRLAEGRALRLNRRTVGLTDTVAHADVVTVLPGETHASGLEPLAMELRVVHEDESLMVIDKPPFLLVHPTEPGQTHTLVNAVAHHYRQHRIDARIHPVHRLDRDTSGMVLIARTPAAHTHLGAQLATRELKREYLALVDGVLAEDAGTVDAPIGRNSSQPVLRAVRPDGDPARTHFRVEERFPGATLVRLHLETGRTHQIRVHMGHLGHPLLGDRQYGRRGVNRIGRQALHAARIAFRHPATGEPVVYEAPLPDDMVRLRAELRRG